MARFLYIKGTGFPEFYLREIARDAHVSQKGDTTVVAFQLDARTGMSEYVRVPVGRFRVRVDSLPCPTAPLETEVTFASADKTIDFTLPCARHHSGARSK
jgi:hypothetical protein